LVISAFHIQVLDKHFLPCRTLVAGALVFFPFFLIAAFFVRDVLDKRCMALNILAAALMSLHRRPRKRMMGIGHGRGLSTAATERCEASDIRCFSSIRLYAPHRSRGGEGCQRGARVPASPPPCEVGGEGIAMGSTRSCVAARRCPGTHLIRGT